MPLQADSLAGDVFTQGADLHPRFTTKMAVARSIYMMDGQLSLSD